MKHLLSVAAAVFVPGVAMAQSLGWELMHAAGPPARYWSRMVHQPEAGTTMLFGGRGAADEFLSDTWRWDGSAWAAVSVAGSAPSARAAHTLVHDSSRNASVLFGGLLSDGSSSAETWEWTGSHWLLRGDSGPAARYGHSMAFDSLRGRVVLHGGYAAGGARAGDTWEFDGQSWALVQAPGPGARMFAAMAFDARRGVTVLFGGTPDGMIDSDETWEYDGDGWRRRPGPGPLGRIQHSMHFDIARGEVVVVGGYSQAARYLGDTWAWDGSRWRELVGQPLPPRVAHSVAYDPGRGEAVVFGGLGDGPVFLGDTRRRLDDCFITRQPADQMAMPDAPVTFVVEVDAAAACTTPVTYQWQRRDPSVLDPASSDAWIDLSDGAGVFGSRGPNLTLLAPTLAFATGFRCRVGGGCGCESGPGTFTFSETVTYSLNCPADFNADGGIDFSDVEAFFERWENGC